jgi:hypothetical protein
MTTYKNIKGIEIKYLSADPPAPTVGQVWYNSTTKVVKGAINGGAGSWASGGNLNTARYAAASSGIQTASLVFGGDNGTAFVSINESYNGSSWTELADLSVVKRFMAGLGTQTATLAIGGRVPGSPPATNHRLDTTEIWNGTGWTEVNNLNTATDQFGGCGTTTAGLVAGGATPPGSSTKTETWNGTSWTEVNNLNSARGDLGVVGTTTSSLAFGGQDGPESLPGALNESWDGTSWTEVADLNASSIQVGAAGTSNSLALSFGGNPTSAKTESWNGSSWTEVADLATGRENLTGAGTTLLALAIGGATTAAVANTEEWTVPSSINNLTVASS